MPNASRRIPPGQLVRHAAVRAAFGAGERVSPGRAAAIAGSMWFTPPRPRPAVAIDPQLGGIDFEVDLEADPVDITLQGTAWGQDGPAVFFIHGWGGQGSQVGTLVSPLLDRGFRVITFDAPAHGRSASSSPGHRRTNAVEFGRALTAVVEQYGPARAVVAHSLGAVATGLALAAGGFRCDRLVLLAPVTQVVGQLEMFGRHLGLGPRTRRLLPAHVERYTGLAVDGFELAGLLEHTDTDGAVVVHDRDDRLSPYAEAAALVRHWPRASLVTTQGLGHQRLLRDPAVVRSVVEALTADLPSDSRRR